MIVWFTGMSGSGKTTLTDQLNLILKEKGFSVKIVDGDSVRKQNETTQIFTIDSILENNYSIIDECLRVVDSTDFLLVSVISPFEETRQYAKEKLGNKYFEIFVNCPVETLIKRDTKGLYKKAQRGEIDNLIGFSKKLNYEIPISPDLTIRTDQMDEQDAITSILINMPFHLKITISE